MTTSTKPAKPDAISKALPDYGIFVECVATRNKLQTHGFWIDLEKCEKPMDIIHAIQWIMKTSPNPEGGEWDISDNTCPTFLIDKSFPEICEWMNDRTSLPEDEGEAFEEYTNDLGHIVTKRHFEDAFMGFFESEKDFVERRYEQTEGVNIGPIHAYVDWQSLWDREYELDGWKACSCMVSVLKPDPNGRGMKSSYQSRTAIFRPV